MQRDTRDDGRKEERERERERWAIEYIMVEGRRGVAQ